MSNKFYTAIAVLTILLIGVWLGSLIGKELAYKDGYNVGYSYCKKNL